MWAAIGAFISLALELWKYFSKGEDPSTIIAEVHAVVAQLNQAKTAQEKQDAAAAIQKILAGH